MELIRTIKNKYKQLIKDTSDYHKAKEMIYLDNFDKELFIAFNGIPYIPIDKNTTAEEIINKLLNIRQNYIDNNLKQK